MFTSAVNQANQNHTRFNISRKMFELERHLKVNNQKKGFGQMGMINELIFFEKLKRMNVKNNFRKTKKSEFLYYKYLFNTSMQCVFSMTSIFSSVLSYEIEYDMTEEKAYNNIGLNLALWMSFISSICLWATIIYEYIITSKINSINKNVPKKIWRKEKGNFKDLIITLLVFFIHPNPVLNGVDFEIYNDKYEVRGVHSLNSFMTVISLIRLWYFLKYYLVFSDYFSPRAQRICKINNFDVNLKFSMKASMIKTPYQSYLLLFFIVLFYCAYCLRIFERILDEASGKNFSSIWNAIWCLIITMTTVGYGDFYPSSFFGRFIGIIACICGVFLISMLIVTITNLLNFQGIEENVYIILQRLKLRKDKDYLATQLIGKYMTLLNIIKNSSNKDEVLNNKKITSMREDIIMKLHYFKEKISEIESTFPVYSSFDIVLDNLDMVDVSMTNLKTKYEILENNLLEVYQKLS